jgi:RNA polymerase sigma factor (sigma-70 family)
MSEQTTLNFISSFINKHPRLTRDQETYYLTVFKCAYNTRVQLLKEKKRIEEQILLNESAIENLFYMDDLVEIDYILNNSAMLKKANSFRNKLVEHNLKLVIKNAKYYQNNGLPFDDVFQEGIIGFIRAIERFDLDEGVKLATYATWWIRQAITRAISNKNRVIRLPVHVLTDVSKVLSFVKKNDIPINNDAIAYVVEEFGFSDKKSEALLNYILSFNPLNHISDSYTEDDSSESESESEDYFDEDSFGKIEYLRDTLDFENLIVSMNEALFALDPLNRVTLVHRLGLGDNPPCHYAQLQALLYKAGFIVTKPRETIQGALRQLLSNSIKND